MPSTLSPTPATRVSSVYTCHCTAHTEGCCLVLHCHVPAGAAVGAAEPNVDRAFIMGEFEALRTLLDVMRWALAASLQVALRPNLWLALPHLAWHWQLRTKGSCMFVLDVPQVHSSALCTKPVMSTNYMCVVTTAADDLQAWLGQQHCSNADWQQQCLHAAWFIRL